MKVVWPVGWVVVAGAADEVVGSCDACKAGGGGSVLGLKLSTEAVDCWDVAAGAAARGQGDMEFEAGGAVLEAELSAGTADVWDWIGLSSSTETVVLVLAFFFS